MATVKKKSSPAQIAARKLFAERAKAGTLKTSQSKRKQNPIVSGYNNLTRADLEGRYGKGNVKFKRDGEIHVFGVMPNSNKTGWYLHSFSKKVEDKRAVNPIKRIAKPKPMAVYNEHKWWCVDFSFPKESIWSRAGYFETKDLATEYGKALADSRGVKVRVYLGSASKML